MRLKRVFGKLGKSSAKVHFISDTLENCRDLRWFLQRYPMEVKDLDRLTERATEHKERLQDVAAILAEGYVPQDFDLAVPARDYQKIAAELCLTRGGLLLADDVGAGKTASAICMIIDPRARPAVVVTLTHLPRQWRDEFKKFAPGLKVHIVKSGKPYPLTGKGLFNEFPDVIIINYHKLAGWSEALAAAGIKSITFDEGQELRRSGNAKGEMSAKYSAALHLAEAVDYRLACSATPIYNYGAEMYNVLRCIFPGQLGTRQEFGTEWCAYESTADKALIKDPKAFGNYLRDEGMMLRRTTKDIGRELPEAQIVTQDIDADESTLDEVGNSCRQLAKLILSDAIGEKGEKMRAAEEFSNRLRQATGLAKAAHVAYFVRILLESGEPVVLYGWHRAVYAVWMDLLKDLKPVLYTGSETVPQKEEAKRKFVSGETNLMILSLRSGAGLDGLQHRCRIVVFGELDYSPAVHTQNIGRVLRDGQTRSVLAYYLLADTGSDPVVSQILGVKRQQQEAIRRNPGEEELVEQLQTDGGHIKRLAQAYLEGHK